MSQGCLYLQNNLRPPLWQEYCSIQIKRVYLLQTWIFLFVSETKPLVVEYCFCFYIQLQDKINIKYVSSGFIICVIKRGRAKLRKIMQVFPAWFRPFRFRTWIFVHFILPEVFLTAFYGIKLLLLKDTHPGFYTQNI